MQHNNHAQEESDFREVLYRDNLNRFREKANGKELLNLRETAALLGVKDPRTVKKMFPFVNGYITIATLARCVTMDFAQGADSSQSAKL